MYLTVKTNLFIEENQMPKIFEVYGKYYHEELERLVGIYQKENGEVFIPYRDISNKIAFHSKEQLLRLANTFYEIRKKHPKAQFHRLFVLSRRSFSLNECELTMEFGRGFMYRPVTCCLLLTNYQKNILSQGEILRMDVKKELKQYAVRFIVKPQVCSTQEQVANHVMGIDLGMKCPAVCYTDTHKVKFIGNGRKIKYESRKINEKYRELQKQNHEVKLQKYAHKLHNYRMYVDHCISKEIIDFAKKEGITLIRLEKLLNLQQKFHRHDQVCWSYQRLANFIEYKAALAGICVEYVDPFLTTKKCPNCGKVNNVKGRDYLCKCGFRKHRDLVGAMNILHAPKA